MTTYEQLANGAGATLEGAFNPNEAPAGYRAVECDYNDVGDGICSRCQIGFGECNGAHCIPGRRVDGCNVIFVRR